MVNDLHFLHPEWLWLLLVIPVVWGMRLLNNHQQGGWDKVVDKHLMPFVLSGKTGSLGWFLALLLSLGLLAAVLAMAGPAWEKREVPVFRNQQPLVVAMDFSASMSAEDEKPNRLTLARFKLLDILNARKDAQNALVVFAGDAFTVSPLTDDIDTIQEQVKNLTPDIMPAPGSLLTPAIQRSVELLQQAGMKKGSILLMTDGVSDPEAAIGVAEEAHDRGYDVSVLAIGSADGAPIPRGEGGFLLDSFGKTVVAKVNLDDLKRVAQAGGGVFVQAALGEADLATLSSQWQASIDGPLQDAQGRQTDAWANEGYWLVLLLLPLAALAFRRGWLGVALACVLLPQPQPSYAFGWQDLWKTPDQQGQEALDNGQPDVATKLFKDTTRKGIAAYQSGDYAAAEQLLKNDKSVTGRYNYGNTLAKQGKWKEAVTAYEDALEQQPGMEDAEANLSAVEWALKNVPKPDPKSKKPDEDGKKENGLKDDPNGNVLVPDPKGNIEQQMPDANGKQEGTGEKADPNGEEEGAGEKADPNGEEEGGGGKPDPNGKAGKGEGQADEAKSNGKKVDGDKKGQKEYRVDPQQREQEQATEQWLRRIPDDPAGLWRRKFQYQYQQRGAQARGDEW